MTFSKEDLLAIVRNYYNSTNDFLFTLEPSLEENRREALWTRRIEDLGSWRAFMAKLRKELPGYNTGATYSSADGGPRCVIYPPRESWSPESNWSVVGCVSLLAPFYFIYGVTYDYTGSRTQNYQASFGPPPLDMISPTEVVAKAIESVFGFRALSRELAETPVPLYAGLLEPPKTTLFHTLFTSAPSSVP